METLSKAPRTYGNWRKPTSPGVLGLGMLPTIAMLFGLIVTIFTMIISMALAVLFVILMCLALGPLTMRDRHGRNGMQWISARVAWTMAKARGQHLYRSGPIGRTPPGTCQLPGLAAKTRLHEAVDAYNRPFGLLHIQSVDDYTVVLQCDADGAALVDDDQVDTWVAYWGQWLANLGNESGLVAASITVETAPDTGERLREEITGNLHSEAPELARRVLTKVMDDYSEGAARITTRIALTFEGRGRAARKRRTAQEMATEIGTRLPALTSSLSMTGAGTAVPLSAAQIAAAVRVAYDPTVAVLVDKARTEGGLGLRWNEAGPFATQESWSHYRHDGAFSITWAMSDAPRGEVFATVLHRLLAPHEDILRKRVTILYRPHDPGTAARLVERDIKDARFKASQAKRASARDTVGLTSAEQTALEEATGAGLLRFGMLVTATVDHVDKLELAASTVENLSASARLVLRRAYGAQASSFAAALPLGLVLPRHVRVPQALRESM
ncbi:SCO6880 family protein [Yinghuangia sp. YIM S10712]|uniref:SCO6880 family protein n=1 Tax=Yinghuangia sp. YIM S10712 TaxID=3436930 RepID=UPI003F52A98E